MRVQCGTEPWQDWGTYLSGTGVGTVREDYSANGDAWNYFPYAHARSAHRWNEDGLAGGATGPGTCASGGLWNGVDDHPKERPFGLKTNEQGNRGEDVKDYWFYTDNAPDPFLRIGGLEVPPRSLSYDDPRGGQPVTHHRGNPNTNCSTLESMWRENCYLTSRWSTQRPPNDMVCRMTAVNRAPGTFRSPRQPNGGSATCGRGSSVTSRRESNAPRTVPPSTIPSWGATGVTPQQRARPPNGCSENNTNNEVVFGTENASAFCQDGVNNAIVDGRPEAVNQEGGSKAAAVASTVIPRGLVDHDGAFFADRATRCIWRSGADPQRSPARGGRITASWQCQSLSEDENSSNAKQSPVCCGANSSTTTT